MARLLVAMTLTGCVLATDAAANGAEAGDVMETVLALYEKYWEGYGAESTDLLYHHRLDGPKGLDALSSPDEVAALQVNGKQMPYGYGSGIQDVALENGQLLYALCDAYDATGDERLAEIARRTWRGMKLIGSVSPEPGFVPRGPHPDTKSYYPNSSRDQHAVYVYALWRWFRCPLATEEDRAFIVQFMDAFAGRMEGNKWHVYVEDNSEIAHVGFSWRQSALAGVMSLTGTLSAVVDVSDNARWRDLLAHYEEENEGFRWQMLGAKTADAWQTFTLYSNQFGLDLDALAAMHEGEERGEQVRGFMRAVAEHAMRSNVFDTEQWRRLDWASNWDEEKTERAVRQIGLSLDEPATVMDLWEHFSVDSLQATEWTERNVSNKLCFGMPTVAVHLALLSRDEELVAEVAPVVVEMMQTILDHGELYDRGENFNRTVVMGLHLVALHEPGAL